MSKKIKAWLLPLIGAVMCLWAVAMLVQMPSYSQYAFQTTLSQAEVRDKLKQAQMPDTSILGISYGQSVGGVSSVTVVFVGQGYLAFHPIGILSGDGLSEYAVKTGAKYCLMDEQLAFMLFDSGETEGKTADFEGQAYKLGGTVSYSRGAGDRDDHIMYIPLCSCEDASVQLYTLIANKVDLTRASAVFEGGQVISLYKEKVRSVIFPCAVLLMVSVMLIKQAVAWYKRKVKGYIAKTRVLSQEYYTGRTILMSLPQGALWALTAALGIGICALLLVLFSKPLYIFSEWVPDDPVSLDSILARIRQNQAAAAAPVRYTTRESAKISSYAGFIKWGTLLMSAGISVNWLKARITATKE